MAAKRQQPSSPNAPVLYRPADVAKMLHCSEWWVREQARKRRIPFSWIGGSYRFTDEHVAEIVRLSEVAPAPQPTVADVAPPRKPLNQEPPRTRLRARTPRRAMNKDRGSHAA